MDVIMAQLQNSPLEYRDKLSIPKKVNFGLELELDKVNPKEVYKLVRKQFGNWIIKEDKGLTKGENAEIVSPVLQNNKDTWIALRKMGDILEKIKPKYDRCSFQVNFDGSLLPDVNDRVRFLKLYAMYEDIIYRFSRGDDGCYRDSLEMYASPIILALKGALSISDEAAVEMFSNHKRYGIAFKSNDKDLIEFRTPNMTSNPVYWQNYINTFYYLLMCAANPRYDKKEVDKYIDEFSRIYILEGYEFEKKEKALRLAKMIFPHNVDKVNFMHQYIGNGDKPSIRP